MNLCPRTCERELSQLLKFKDQGQSRCRKGRGKIPSLRIWATHMSWLGTYNCTTRGRWMARVLYKPPTSGSIEPIVRDPKGSTLSIRPQCQEHTGRHQQYSTRADGPNSTAVPTSSKFSAAALLRLRTEEKKNNMGMKKSRKGLKKWGVTFELHPAINKYFIFKLLPHKSNRLNLLNYRSQPLVQPTLKNDGIAVSSPGQA